MVAVIFHSPTRNSLLMQLSAADTVFYMEKLSVTEQSPLTSLILNLLAFYINESQKSRM